MPAYARHMHALVEQNVGKFEVPVADAVAVAAVHPVHDLPETAPCLFLFQVALHLASYVLEQLATTAVTQTRT